MSSILIWLFISEISETFHFGMRNKRLLFWQGTDVHCVPIKYPRRHCVCLTDIGRPGKLYIPEQTKEALVYIAGYVSGKDEGISEDDLLNHAIFSWINMGIY